MRFGKRRTAAAAVVMVCGAMALVSFVSAQTLDRDFRYDVFRALGAGSEIGVSVRELSNDEVSKARLERAGGVYVQSIREGSPAARADIRSGDLIVEVDGERVRGVRHFVRLVSESPAGRSVRIETIRGSARNVIDVTPEAARFAPVLPPEIREDVERRLSEFPRDLELDLPAPRTARARLGITTTPLTNQLAGYFGVKDGGVLVSAVEERSPSATAGVKAGDVIIAIDGAPVRTPQDVAAAARRAAPGAVLDFRVVREKKETTLAIRTAAEAKS
ncbi:MAG TPA: PDZ domain-containing protein [Vicinamibacterales bacterium]|nr:PDZ domain-containing protein [Vicinamibacterales bacterium]